jgi:hypothetical protein
MNSLSGTNTIIVKSSKDNPNYTLLRQLGTTDENIKQLLQQHKMNVVEDLSGGPTDFNLYVYNDQGLMYTSLTSFNKDSFKDIFTTVEAASNQKGGSTSDHFKHKYLKYKHKYEKLKKSKI